MVTALLIRYYGKFTMFVDTVGNTDYGKFTICCIEEEVHSIVQGKFIYYNSNGILFPFLNKTELNAT